MVATGTSGNGSTPFDELAARLTDRDRRRAGRWLDRSGGLTPMPDQAGDLLAVRLAAQARLLRRVGLPVGMIAVGWLGWWIREIFRDDTGSVREGYGLSGLICALVVVRLLLDVGLTRAEKRIRDALPHRVAREAPAPVTVVLGRLATWWLVLAVGVAVALAVTFVVLRPDGPSWVRALAVLLVAGWQGVVVAGQVRREPIALDAHSLAVDERLRSERARQSLSVVPLILLLCLPRYDGPLPHGVESAGSLVILLLLGTSLVVLLHAPWQTARGKAWTSPVRLRDDAAGS